jgi:hypothetical protein
VGVQHIDEARKLVDFQRRADLQADGVLDAARKFHVGAVELAGAFADPHQVGRGVVPIARGRIDPCHRLLDAQQQGFVAGEELDLAQAGVALRIDADRFHEGQRLADLVGQRAIGGALRRASDKAEGPAMDVVQIGVAAAGEGAQQIQRRRRLAIGLQQALRVRRTGLDVELHAIDDVAAIGRQGHFALRLHCRRARLGELAGHAAHLHHRTAAREGHHHRHLQHQAEGVADVVGVKFLEALGAVAALQQEGAAFGDIAQQRLQPPRLTGEDQRRHAAQPLFGAREAAASG